MSKDVIHKRLGKEIKAAIVFNDKEGPDEAIVFSFIVDDLQKSDYLVYENTNFLVYEDIRLTDSDINYKKQRAVECNVIFGFEDKNYIGYFRSSLRGSESPDFVGKEMIKPNETPILILPTNDDISINSEFAIEGKPFKVSEYDNITNKGITYYYLERGFTKKEGPIGDSVVDPGSSEDEIVEDRGDELRAMVEHTVDTENAYFAASPRVEVIARTRSKITFKIPFGISEVVLETRKEGEVLSKLYRVVI